VDIFSTSIEFFCFLVDNPVPNRRSGSPHPL
jgi:hypothetical protein